MVDRELEVRFKPLSIQGVGNLIKNLDDLECMVDAKVEILFDKKSAMAEVIITPAKYRYALLWESLNHGLLNHKGWDQYVDQYVI